jgi:hypothetical protein
MLLSAAAFLVAVVSPVGIDVATRDGSHRLLEHIDADTTVVEVCARRRDKADAPVCAAVVDDRSGARVTVDIDDTGDLVFSKVVTRFDARTAAPAALAAGLGLTAIITGVVAASASLYAASGGPSDGNITGVSGAVDVQPGAAEAGSLAVALWGASIASGAAGIIVGVAAWSEANERHAE